MLRPAFRGSGVFRPLILAQKPVTGFIEHPHDKIRVFVDFAPVPVNGTGRDNTRVRPIAFFWAGKRYDIQSVNLIYRRKIGKKDAWCFAVSDHANTFILTYNPESLEWQLDEIQGS